MSKKPESEAGPTPGRARPPTEAEELARAGALVYLRNMADHLGVTIGERPSRADLPALQTIYDALARSTDDMAQAGVALGVGFGQALCATDRFTWVHAADHNSAEQSLKLKGHQFWISPISMIRDRLATRTETDLDHLYAQTLATVDEAVRQFTGAAT